MDINNQNFQFVTQFQTPLTISPDSIKTFLLSFSPIETGGIVGEIRIESNDPSKLISVIVLNGTATGSAGNPQVTISSNKFDYYSQDDLEVKIDLSNPGEPKNVDLFIFTKLPEGSVFFLTAGGFSLLPEPINFDFPGNLNLPVTVFSTNITDDTLKGEYLWGAGLFEPGTLIPLGDVDSVIYKIN